MGERRGGGGGGVRDQLKPCFSVLAGEYGKFFLKLWHRSANACRDIQAVGQNQTHTPSTGLRHPEDAGKRCSECEPDLIPIIDH